MNHRYFASLLENYRRRTDVDSSLLSIRKAIFDSYKNESFKLKERQRHAMAKQRRDEMENDRIFRNKLKEITEKEKEISKRYEHLRKFNVKNKNETSFAANNVSGWQNNYLTNGYRNELDLSRETISTSKKNCSLVGRKLSKLEATYVNEITEAFSAINSSSWRSEHATGILYKKECHVHLPREQTLETQSFYAELENRKVGSKRGFTNVNKREAKQLTPPPSPTGSNFANELIDYYKNVGGQRRDKNAPAFVGKKTGISTMKLGVEKKHLRQKGPLNVTSLDYDIMVIDHGKEDDSV